MCDETQEQHINIKFFVKLDQTPGECHALLQEAYGDHSLSRAAVFKWFKRFKEGQEITEDDLCQDQPVSVSSPEVLVPRTICDETQEQRINIKFLFKLNKTAPECHALLQEAYGDHSLSRAAVFKWFKRFKEGRESTGDDLRQGRPVSVSTPEKVAEIKEMWRANPEISIRQVAKAVNADKESVRKILLQELALGHPTCS